MNGHISTHLVDSKGDFLKMMIYTRLLHNTIGNVPDFDFTVYRDIPVRACSHKAKV
jgi:hypothetical protein